MTASLVVLAHDYGPEWSRDIRIFIASVPLQQSPGSNSNYGIFMAERILHGQGPGLNWARMPGYGYLIAFVGLGSGAEPLVLGVRSILLHMLFSAVGLALVAAALSGIIGRVPAALTAGVLSVVPTTVDVTMIDGIMQGMALLTLAAGAFVIKAET